MRNSRRGPGAHEHQWEDGEIIFEDGKAVVSEQCTYQPTKSAGYSERLDEEFHAPAGPPCDETRITKFKPTQVVNHGKWIEVEDREDEKNPLVESCLMKAEQGWQEGDVMFDEVDPDPQHGTISVEVGDCYITYEPNR